jgi:bifunctional DNA-binding transcriptional regulator/antitoxin component of YhaV-PrlF toxin-antitoxin module
MGTSLTITNDSDLELAKVVRESLHLQDGDRVRIETTGDGLVVRREEAGRKLVEENGLLVCDSAGDIGEQPVHLEDREGILVVCGGPPLPGNSIVDLIREMREERDRQIGGW